MVEPSTSLVCNFCSATESAEGGPLLGCASCEVAAYCCSDHQTRDWCRHKVWCKVHSSRAHSARTSASEQSAASSSVATGAASAAPTNPTLAAAAPAAALATTKRMDSIRRIDSGHALDEQASSSSINGNATKRMAMTTSSSGSSQTSGHSSGTDCSLASMGSTAAAAAAAAAPVDYAAMLAQLGVTEQMMLMLSQQQLAAAAAAAPAAAQPALLPPIDPSVFLAASNPQFYSGLALMMQQQAAATSAAAAAAAPPPPQSTGLFPPLIGSVNGLSLSNFAMPPPPSAFPTVSAIEPANINALLASLGLPQQQQQPRFDLGAADPTPMMFASSSASRVSAPSTSAFAPPPPRQSVVTSTFSQQRSSQPLFPTTSSSSSFPLRSAFSSSSSLHSATSSSSSRVPTTVPNPFTYATTPSSMQKIIDPKPSMTVPPLRPKAVAARRGGKPAALAAAAAAAAAAGDELHQHPTSSAASGGAPSTSSSSGGAPTNGDKRFSPERGTRKRTTPSPKEKEERKWQILDNNTVKEMPLDFEELLQRMQAAACTPAKNERRKRPEEEDDDDCQVIGEVINRRYRDHTENVIYNFSVTEHMADMRRKGMLMSRHQATMLRIRYMAEHVIRSLNEFGWAVVDNFLSVENTKHCAKEMEKLYEKGLFTAGQLVDHSDDEDWTPPTRNEDDIRNVRSDYIFWYDGVDERATEAVTTRLLVSMLDSLMLHFNGRIEGKEVGGRSRAMLAIYPGGSSRYVKHIDNPNLDGRLVTCIYYCNSGWNMKEHGGALRLFPETSECAIDIDPQADRLVFFWSDRRNPHEVMPVYRHRFAVTIWYMEKNERAAALERKQRRKAAAAAALGISVEALPTNKAELMRMLQMVQHNYGEHLLRFGSMPQTHASAPHMANAAAAAIANATALGLPPAAAAIGRAASPRSRSDNNMARRFEVARSECTQDEVESEDEDIGDFIPPNTGAQPDYEI